MRVSEIWSPFAAHRPPGNKAFFEGWYFKHTHADGRVICLIPGIARDADQQAHAFIQVIAAGLPKPLFVHYPAQQFYATRSPFEVRIGNSVFSLEGCCVDIEHEGLHIRGQVRYDKLMPLKDHPASPGIMGPFSFVPGMSCIHGVISLHHRLEGSLAIGDEVWQMAGGTGYIEKDWGTSFPDHWLWMQANCFEGHPSLSFMAAVATIPYAGLKFNGLICVLCHNGRQHRLATYNLARVESITRRQDGWICLSLRKGSLRLQALALHKHAGELRAPQMGAMQRVIHESPATRLHLTVQRRGRTVLRAQSVGAGMECVGDYLSLA